ncbi:MAG TPA: hypothetical protein VHL10_04780 [Nitrososphaera sp.]|nr:hypothetical protein [Nitrososphaera sp.]
MIKIINETESIPFVKSYATLLSGIIAALLITGFISQAFAADMAARLITDLDKSNATFVGVKNLTLRYPEGSSIAQQLNGKTDRLDFTLNGTATDPGVASLIQETNKAFAAARSPVQATAAVVHYQAKISGGPSAASVSVKVEYHPTIEKFVLSKDAQSGGTIVDLVWRSFVINGPVIVKSPDGDVNINQAIGVLDAKYPDLASKLSSSGVVAPLQEPVMDFSRFNTPMGNWHFLFDPVGAYGGGTITGSDYGGARALSVYSLGESSFREGTFEAQETQASGTIDGSQVSVKAQTPPPSGQLTIAGYSKLQGNQGSEFAIVTSEAPADAQTSSGGFPIQVLLVFGGMMGAIAIFILFKARK